MDVPFNNDKIKKEVIKGKGGKGPDGVETDLVKYIGTKEDLEKLMDKDFDGEYKNSIKKLDESEDAVYNHLGERCPKCGSGNYFEVDGAEYDDGTQEFKLVCADCGYESSTDELNHNDLNEAEEAQLNDLYNADKIEWEDLSGSDQTAVDYFSNNFADSIADKSWDEVESDIIASCHEIGYANEELIDNDYWNDGDMDPEPDEKKVTDYIFQNYFLPKKNSKNMNESAETNMTLKEYAMKYFDGDIDIDVTDTDVYMLVAFVNDFNEEPKDNYDRFLNLLGERTKVVKVGNNVLTCDFSSVFKPYEDKLQDFFNMDYSEFNEAYYEAVVNLEPLISGNAGEKTYGELLDILNGKQMNESAEIDSDKDSRKFADMVMELHSYVDAEPGKISRDLKAAIKSNKLEDYLKHKAAMNDEEISNFKKKYSSESINESFDVNKVAKRIARYKEFDKHIFHSWYEELSPDKAEEMARQASLENPEDVFYVAYDDIMNPCSEYRYVNGVQYNINDGGFHWTNGLPKFHTDADWQAVYNREKTWEEIDAMNESANIDVNNLTKEQLWKLRQEIVLGSLYTSDYNNSFGIDPSAVYGFFDGFIEDAQMDDYGKPNDRETEEYDNAEDLYNYYRSCENPFGEINNMNESANYEGYTDKEIIKDVIDNFKKITGKEIKDVLNYDENNEGFFKQGVVESTGESIINYLTKKGLSRSHIDELLYELDDELTSLWNKL